MPTAKQSVALLSPGGDSIARRSSDASELLVGTVDGIFILRRDEKGEWSLVHRALEGCFVSAITELHDGTLIAGTHGVGLATSRDGGRTWVWTNNGITHFDVWAARSGTIAGREVLFAGTMPARLFVSDDAGATWRDLPALISPASAPRWFFPPPPHLGHVKDIVVDRNGTLLVGIEVGALLSSADAGKSFREFPIDPDPTEVDLHRILVHPDRPDRIVIATGFGIMTSHDRGGTWRRGPAPEGMDYPDPMVLHPDDPDLLFVAGAVGWPPHWYRVGRSRAKIARSRDGGKTWERLLTGLPDGQRAIFSALTLYASDTGYQLFAADTDGQVFESRDGGDSWRIIAETGPVSKGDFYRGLAKGRPRLANVDDLKFFDTAAERLAKANV